MSDIRNVKRELARIDKAIARLHADYRVWRDNPQKPTAFDFDPFYTLRQIDALLDLRHRLTLERQGEMANPDDVASPQEWGELG